MHTWTQEEVNMLGRLCDYYFNRFGCPRRRVYLERMFEDLNEDNPGLTVLNPYKDKRP
jgi:hypothetical protein